MHRRNQFGRTQRGLLIRLHLTVRSGIVFFPIKRIQPNSRGENKAAPPPTVAMDDRCSKTLKNRNQSPPSPLLAALAACVSHRLHACNNMHSWLQACISGSGGHGRISGSAGRRPQHLSLWSRCTSPCALPRLLLVPTKNDTCCSKKVYRFQQKSLPLQPAIVIVAKMLTRCSFCGCRLQQKMTWL